MDGGFGALTTVVALEWSFGDLTADAAGNLFGTDHEASTVFEVTGSGFQVACFLSGTRIATEFGEARVEELRTGDRVRCLMQGAAQIVWIGRRRIDVRRHPDPSRVWPVRVRNGAFGDGMPGRDLFLSPDHAVFVDDVLIPIRCLVNGGTIAQVPMDAVSYYHIELAEHDVLSVEGLPVEILSRYWRSGEFRPGRRCDDVASGFHGAPVGDDGMCAVDRYGSAVVRGANEARGACR